MSKRINVNAKNSKLIGGKLYITGMKMHQLTPTLTDNIVSGSTIEYPGMGKMYEYNGEYSRATASNAISKSNVM